MPLIHSACRASSKSLQFAALMMALATVYAPTALAQPTWNVEVLAFEQPGAATRNAALWSFDAAPPPPADPQVATPGVPNVLDATRVRLDGNGFRTVAHVAWQQPVLTQQDARPTPVPANESVSGSLGGYLRVWRGKYLHIDADLHYRGSAGEGRLRVRRKVPSGQAVYLDHELFGVLVYLFR